MELTTQQRLTVAWLITKSDLWLKLKASDPRFSYAEKEMLEPYKTEDGSLYYMSKFRDQRKWAVSILNSDYSESIYAEYIRKDYIPGDSRSAAIRKAQDMNNSINFSSGDAVLR